MVKKNAYFFVKDYIIDYYDWISAFVAEQTLDSWAFVELLDDNVTIIISVIFAGYYVYDIFGCDEFFTFSDDNESKSITINDDKLEQCKYFSHDRAAFDLREKVDLYNIHSVKWEYSNEYMLVIGDHPQNVMYMREPTDIEAWQLLSYDNLCKFVTLHCRKNELDQFFRLNLNKYNYFVGRVSNQQTMRMKQQVHLVQQSPYRRLKQTNPTYQYVSFLKYYVQSINGKLVEYDTDQGDEFVITKESNHCIKRCIEIPIGSTRRGLFPHPSPSRLVRHLLSICNMDWALVRKQLDKLENYRYLQQQQQQQVLLLTNTDTNMDTDTNTDMVTDSDTNDMDTNLVVPLGGDDIINPVGHDIEAHGVNHDTLFTFLINEHNSRYEVLIGKLSDEVEAIVESQNDKIERLHKRIEELVTEMATITSNNSGNGNRNNDGIEDDGRNDGIEDVSSNDGIEDDSIEDDGSNDGYEGDGSSIEDDGSNDGIEDNGSIEDDNASSNNSSAIGNDCGDGGGSNNGSEDDASSDPNYSDSNNDSVDDDNGDDDSGDIDNGDEDNGDDDNGDDDSGDVSISGIDSSNSSNDSVDDDSGDDDEESATSNNSGNNDSIATDNSNDTANSNSDIAASNIENAAPNNSSAASNSNQNANRNDNDNAASNSNRNANGNDNGDVGANGDDNGDGGSNNGIEGNNSGGNDDDQLTYICEVVATGNGLTPFAYMCVWKCGEKMFGSKRRIDNVNLKSYNGLHVFADSQRRRHAKECRDHQHVCPEARRLGIVDHLPAYAIRYNRN